MVDNRYFKGVIVIKSGGKTRADILLLSCLVLMSVVGGGCRGIYPRSSVCEVQGTGLVSPFLGQEVVVSGLVSVDLKQIEPGSFLILDTNCSQPEGGSRGLFISLDEGEDILDLGDEIRVRGTIQEIEGETRLQAKLSDLKILSLGNSLPEPVDLSAHLTPPLVFGYENWESQLVAIPKADLVESRGDPSRALILPEVVPDPPLQLVCFQRDSLALQINGDLLRSDLDSSPPGRGLEDLVGLIRQDKEGYFLQLIEQPTVLEKEITPQIEELQPVSSSSIPVIAFAATATPPPTPSMTPEPDHSPTSTISPTMIPSPTYYPVELQITEVLPNPLGEEPGGEWIEITNPLGERFLLDGIKIGDETSPAGNEGMLRFPDGYYIGQGQTLVIANQAQIFKSWYGFLPDFEIVDSDPRVPDLVPYPRWGKSSIKLSNSGDEVLLVDPWDTVVDQLCYGESGLLSAPDEGHSLARIFHHGEQDQLEEWRECSSPSPGKPNPALPTTTATDTASPTPATISSLTPTSSSVTPSLSPSPTLSIDPSPTADTPPESKTPGMDLTPTARSTPTGTPSSTPTDPPSASCTPALTLPATPSLPPAFSVTPSGTCTLTPEVTFTLAVSVTVSPTLEPLPTSTTTQTPFLTTPSGTVPPTRTPSKTPGPRVVINEILADPDPVQGDSNRDGVISSDDDEFLELVNISEQALDLSGWMVFDGVRLRFTIPEGTILGPGCGLVVFGGGQPEGDFGGSLVFTASSLGLNNRGDVITMKDPAGIEVAGVSYGPEGNQDQSLTRNPDLIGPLPLVPHSQLPQAGGKLFSPGTRSDGAAFGRCP